MGFINKLNGNEKNRATTGDYETVTLTQDMCDLFFPPEDERPTAIRMRPFKENRGIEAGAEFLESIYEPRIESGFRSSTNVSDAHAFEVRYTQGRINLQFVPGAPEWVGKFESQLQDKYPDSQFERTPAESLMFQPGMHVAAADISLAKNTLYPIKHLGVEGFNRDPFGGITSELSTSDVEGDPACDIMLQVIIRPAHERWYLNAGERSTYDIANELENGTYYWNWRLFRPERVHVPAGPKQKKAAKIVRDMEHEHGWETNLRVVAVSEDKRMAQRRAEGAGTMFRNFYESSTGQRFEAEPVPADELNEFLELVAKREFTESGMFNSELEAAGYFHGPNSEINQQDLDWALARIGEGVPPGTPRFDFDKHGLTMADRLEKQVGMIEESGRGDPIWFGFGSRSGIEAGMYEGYLNAHGGTFGGTRKGKSTLNHNVSTQWWERDYGALVITPGKEDDDEKFIENWPQDRPREDFVFVDTGDEFEKKVMFNLLEVPDHLEPGTAEFSSYVEAMSEDLAAAIAQAGGKDNYWGALMSRVLNMVVHGFARSGHTASAFDAAAVCSAKSGLEQFSDMMTEEHIDFIEDTAARVREKEDSDLEPLAGRMDKIVFNDTLRMLLSARNPSVSIQELVDENKVVVIRLDPALGNTERNFVTTPLVRRFYTAKRLSDTEEPFLCMWDEFDKDITPESNVDQMLSEAGGYGFWFWLTCQAPSHQLPERIKKAVGSQVENYFSFSTKDQDADYSAGHHTVEASDLVDLGRYKFYMRTHTDEDEFTHSYKVDAFYPIGEAREKVGKGGRMSTEEVKDLKRFSTEEYGDVPPTKEEIKAESPFYQGNAGDDTEEFEMTDAIRAKTCKAVYDQSIRANSEWVRVDGCAGRIRRYLPDDAPVSTSAKLWGNVLEYIPESHIEREERDDGVYLRCTSQGQTDIFASGMAENAGSGPHRMLLRECYEPLTRAGLVVSIPDQDGTDVGDAIGRLDDVDLLNFDEDMSPREIHEAYGEFEDSEEYAQLRRLTDGETLRVEAESSTGRTKVALTLKHANDAAEDGQRCAFVCREDTAKNVWALLAEDPVGMREYTADVHRIYNGDDLTIGGNKMYRPTGEGAKAQTVWLYDSRTGEYVLDLGDEYGEIRFDSLEAATSDPTMYPEVEGQIEDYEGWTTVKTPVAPVPALSRDMWDIFVPKDGTLELYEGELTGVTIEDLPREVTGTPTDAPNATAQVYGDGGSTASDDGPSLDDL